MSSQNEVKILGYKLGPFALRVEWALKFKGVEYEYLQQDLFNKSPLLLKYNPIYKKVPVLIHNGKPLTESLVIMEYIDETWKDNPLLPEEPYERSVARFWAKFADEKCVPAFFTVFASAGEKQENAVKEARQNLITLEQGLKGKFFGGEKIGFVDVAAAWFPFWIRIIEEVTGTKLVDAEEMPKLSAWFEDIVDVEIVKECLPPRDELLAHNKHYREQILAAST